MRGYSLIEVMVTLALVGLLSAIVLPQFETLVDAVRRDTALDELATAVRTARLEAYAERRTVKLSEHFDSVEIPAGWAVRFPEDVIIRPSGVCLGGRMIIDTLETSIVFSLNPPRCVPQTDEAA